MLFGGIETLMEPDSIVKVEDPAGKHFLQAFEQRGLCRLEFEDDKKAIGEAGRTRNLEFKKLQIVRYNQQNEQRKMVGMGYLPPTKYVRQIAVELGIQLLQPYTMKDVEMSAVRDNKQETERLRKEIDEARQESESLKGTIGELQGQITQLTKILTGLVQDQQGRRQPIQGKAG